MLKAVIDRLDKIFNPEAFQTINTFKFRSTKQFEGESFDEFLDRLNALAKSCNFTRGDSELKHQVIYGCGSDKLRARAMEDDKITLENLIKLAKTIETVDSHIETLKKENSAGEVVNQVRHGSHKRHVEKLSSSSKDNNKPKNICMRCGGSYPHDNKKACPAIGKTCNNCKKKNHFANQCKSKEAKRDASDEISSDFKDYANGIDMDEDEEFPWKIDTSGKRPKVELEICKTKVKLIIDTVASINIIDEPAYNSLYLKPKLIKSATKAYAYGSRIPIPILGQFETRTSYSGTHRRILNTRWYKAMVVLYSVSVRLKS
jgi:hypothetical protein